MNSPWIPHSARSTKPTPQVSHPIPFPTTTPLHADSEIGPRRNPLNLRFEEISHGMGFLQFRDSLGGTSPHKHMVMNIHSISLG